MKIWDFQKWPEEQLREYAKERNEDVSRFQSGASLRLPQQGQQDNGRGDGEKTCHRIHAGILTPVNMMPVECKKCGSDQANLATIGHRCKGKQKSHGTGAEKY